MGTQTSEETSSDVSPYMEMNNQQLVETICDLSRKIARFLDPYVISLQNSGVVHPEVVGMSRAKVIRKLRGVSGILSSTTSIDSIAYNGMCLARYMEKKHITDCGFFDDVDRLAEMGREYRGRITGEFWYST